MTSASSIPVLAIFTNSEVMVVFMAALAGLALTLEVGRLSIPRLNAFLIGWIAPLLKPTEQRALTGATYVAVASLACFLLYDKQVAIAALFFLSLGDPMAALVGSRVGGPRVFGKSPIGSLAFILVSLSIASLLMATDVVDHHWAIGVGAAVAALVELVPLYLDDNVTIPLISGGAMTLML